MKKLDKILAKIQGKGYNIDLDSTDLGVHITEIKTFTYGSGYKHDQVINVLSISCWTDQLPMCCGISEIGGFELNWDKDVAKSIGITPEELSLFLIPKLSKIFKNCSRRGKKMLFMYNIINESGPLFWHDMLKTHFPDKFELVRQFRNINSGNDVDTYLEIVK
jgi:hypothetical protein